MECVIMDFINQLLETLESQKETILTYLGSLSLSGGVVGGAVYYFKTKAQNVVSAGDKSAKVVRDEVNELKKQVEELKEGNKIMSEYIELSSKVKSESTVVSDDLKQQFKEINVNAKNYKEKMKDQIANKIKEKTEEFLGNF